MRFHDRAPTFEASISRSGGVSAQDDPEEPLGELHAAHGGLFVPAPLERRARGIDGLELELGELQLASRAGEVEHRLRGMRRGTPLDARHTGSRTRRSHLTPA